MSGIAAHEIGIVHYPGAQVVCILGLTDLFRAASTIALDQRRSGQSPLRVTHWKPIDSFDANLSCVYDSAPRGSPQPRTLIIPPTMASLPDPDIPPDIPRMDAWFEEGEEVFVHPHDPYKRIDLLHSSRHIEVSLDGVKLADTRRPTIVYETGAPIRYYMPKPDVRMDLLEPTDNRTGCAYKGFARYWSLTVGQIRRENIAWSYAMPIADCAKIAGLVAFYNEGVDLIVDGVPQDAPRFDNDD